MSDANRMSTNSCLINVWLTLISLSDEDKSAREQAAEAAPFFPSSLPEQACATRCFVCEGQEKGRSTAEDAPAQDARGDECTAEAELSRGPGISASESTQAKIRR